MNTKLTLRLDDALIRSAKLHSAKSGKSISRLVADYFTVIETSETERLIDLTPRVRSLIGVLSGAGVGEEDYRRHLEEKYK